METIKTIKNRMVETEMNQSSLAEKLGVSRQYVSKMFKKDLTLLNLIRIAKALKCKLKIEFDGKIVNI